MTVTRWRAWPGPMVQTSEAGESSTMSTPPSRRYAAFCSSASSSASARVAAVENRIRGQDRDRTARAGPLLALFGFTHDLPEVGDSRVSHLGAQIVQRAIRPGVLAAAFCQEPEQVVRLTPRLL
jgi:hypothetical protein